MTAAVPAAADDSGLLVLTDSQAEQLADHARIDAYAAADAPDVDPQGAAAPKTDDMAPSADAAGVSLNSASALEGVRGLGATAPVGGTKGDYFTLHSLGSVQRSTGDGAQVWRRDNASLYAGWKVTPTRAYQAEPGPARIVMGYNAVAPFTPASDQGYSTADLTGDGVDDVVFSASVGVSPYRPFTSPGSTLANGTFVTVLDGRTGRTLWTKLYAYAYEVTVVGKTLLIGDPPYYNLNSPASATATLTGIRFSYADGALTPAHTWTYDTGLRTSTTWSALENAGGGLVAASWSQRKSATAAGHARTLMLDTADGSVRWQTDTALYARQLHLDAGRGRIVALEQSDLTDGVKYEVVSYALADGSRTTLDTRTNALPLDLETGDLRGDRKAEYAVSESKLDPYLYINSNTVRVLDGTDGSTELWSHTVKRDADNSKDGPGAWSLRAVDGKLVAAASMDQGINTADNPGGAGYGSLTVFSGRDGDIDWQQNGSGASPLFAQPYRDGSGRHVRTVDQNQNVRTYAISGGRQQSLTALQGDLSSAQSLDVNGDKKKDLVLGGQSRGLWAYDGPSLVAGSPKLLWKATLPGQVHRIEKGDVDGDGRDELAVAADTATVVVDARTGRVRTTIPGKGGFVRSAAVADVDHDGLAEVVVPTDRVRAYRGNGSKMWEYAAPSSAGDVVFADLSTGDGQVYAQYNSVNSLDLASPVVNGVALNGRTGAVAWTADPRPPAGTTDGKLYATVLRNGTYASPGIPYGDGHAVVCTWVTRDTDLGVRTNVVEIRDGRTGKILHTGLAGGLYTVGNWFTDDDGLVLANTASLYTFSASADYSVYTSPTLQFAHPASGPGGRKLIVGGVMGGVHVWDQAALTAGHNYPAQLAKASVLGGQDVFTGDLDGDGTDEVVSLNFDDSGNDRLAQLLGGRYYLPNTAVHQASVFTLDAS
ncbi:VCBS repeat-containing protein [Streptomyces beijiangensis]|uniref:VCBS repeat-containing protein n=1 Tax=Streptomyces beijiangensis TaxID=163361 RepID=A0A939JEH4_9ACTN|nr:VCBS repeat-containing protein [Streptomyces beijiangensis]